MLEGGSREAGHAHVRTHPLWQWDTPGTARAVPRPWCGLLTPSRSCCVSEAGESCGARLWLCTRSRKMKSLFGGLLVASAHGRGRRGGALTAEQQHSFPRGGCQLRSSAARGLACGAALGTEDLRQGGWPLSQRSRKTSNCSAPPARGSLPARGPGRRSPGQGAGLGGGEHLDLKLHVGDEAARARRPWPRRRALRRAGRGPPTGPGTPPYKHTSAWLL